MSETCSFLGDYQVLKLLSNGTHSKIKLVKRLNSDLCCVAHIFKVPLFFQFFDKEVLALQSFNLDRTIRPIEVNHSGIYTRKNAEQYLCKYFIVDFMELGNLCDISEGLTPLSDDSVKYLFKSILQAVQDLHISDRCHRTIGAKNILFTKDCQVRLSGLTFSERISESFHTKVLSKKYLAPEVSEAEIYDGVKSDIFSLGVILFYLKTFRLPFFSISSSDVHMCLFLRDKSLFWKNFDRKGLLTAQVKNLIEKMIEPNPENRACFNDVINHGWLSGGFITTEEFKLEIETRRQEVLNRATNIKNQSVRKSSEYRDGFNESWSLDYRKLKVVNCVQMFRSNIIYSNMNPKELLNVVSLHGLKKGFDLEQSNEYFQIKATANTFLDLLKYKGYVYQMTNGNFALELEFIEGNFFDFCEVTREVKNLVCSASNKSN